MFENIENWLKEFPFLYQNLKFIGVLLLAGFVYLVTKKILIRGINRLIQKTSTTIDDVLLNDKLLSRIAFLAPFIVINEFIYLLPLYENLIGRILEALIAVQILLILGTIITSLNDLYESSKKFDQKPIKGYLQIVKIFIYVIGGVFVAGILTGKNPWAIMTGIGAVTAIILLIFKDTILSFVASIQISSYDLIKVGDWIEVPKYNADGDVIDIALHTVKVQNFDKTITVIPTYKLIEESFKNWRGMRLTGGRRIKRSIFIDQSSVTFCTKEMLDKFENYGLIKEYLKTKREELKKYNSENNINENYLVNGRRLTNLGVFRVYLKKYLSSREDINKDLTFLVRQLAPGYHGIPIELYVFAGTTTWVEYEEIQADIFDHLLAVVPQFELKIFQDPTGHDFKKIVSNV